MKVTVHKPEDPPVTIELTGEEAKLLKRLVGQIGGGYFSGQGGSLYISGIQGEEATQIRDKVQNPIWETLKAGGVR